MTCTPGAQAPQPKEVKALHGGSLFQMPRGKVGRASVARALRGVHAAAADEGEDEDFEDEDDEDEEEGDCRRVTCSFSRACGSVGTQTT